MKFNVNDNVKVKLTKRGVDIMRQQHNKLKSYYSVLEDFKEPLKDEEGFSTFQMWYLMQTFGSSIYLGCDVPFETTIDIITE